MRSAEGASWLLREVEVDGRVTDCRLGAGEVLELAPGLEPRPGDLVVHGHRAALLPGLADHHLHLRAAAAVAASVDLGGRLSPADVAAQPGAGWLRVIGAADDLKRTDLDAVWPARPVRVAHRSGAMWTLNSAAVAILAGALSAEERTSGQLWRADSRLRSMLAAVGERTQLDLPALGERLARFGVTRLTDATPDVDAESVAELQASLPQQVVSLGGAAGIAPVKVVVADSDLPTLDVLAARIRAIHARGRPVAVHAVSAVALVLTVSVLAETGTHPGDRIEHAAVCDDGTADRLAELGVVVVTQPSVWARHGATFRADSPDYEHDLLWRYAGLLDRGVRVSVSSDAPYGDLDPWRTVHAAATRELATGVVGGESERVEPATVLASLLAEPLDPAGPARRLEPGGPSDAVLLDAPLRVALARAAATGAAPVRMTFLGGRAVVIPSESCPR